MLKAVTCNKSSSITLNGNIWKNLYAKQTRRTSINNYDHFFQILVFHWYARKFSCRMLNYDELTSQSANTNVMLPPRAYKHYTLYKYFSTINSKSARNNFTGSVRIVFKT